jgi:hypothetical protein
MSALDRYDEWAEGLDDELAEIYDRATLDAIDAATGEPGALPPAPAAWRGGIAAGAMVVGLVNGVRDVFDEEAEPVVEIEEERAAARLEPVTVHLAWGNPAASVAVVRRWLF